MRDVTVRTLADDMRPAVVLDDVNGVTIEGFTAQRAGESPRFVLRSVREFAARNCEGIADTRRTHVVNETL